MIDNIITIVVSFVLAAGYILAVGAALWVAGIVWVSAAPDGRAFRRVNKNGVWI